jgi:hypothetical protein
VAAAFVKLVRHGVSKGLGVSPAHPIIVPPPARSFTAAPGNRPTRGLQGNHTPLVYPCTNAIKRRTAASAPPVSLLSSPEQLRPNRAKHAR